MTRNAVIAEAMTWLRTPWHHAQRVKGCGVDCAQFLIAVYAAVGLIPDIRVGYYPQDWHLNQGEPRFLAYLLKYADPVDDPLPGDVAMFQYGRHAAHGSIVVDANGPVVIHAWRDERMVTITDLSVAPLRERLAGFYRLREIV